MSTFLKVYNNIKKELLSEQENIQQDEIQTSPIVGMDDAEDQVVGSNQEDASISTKLDPDEEVSALKEDEKGLIDKTWIDKIIKLLNFLDKEDDNVKDIISKLSDTDNIKDQKSKIEELLNSIPPEKTS